MGQPGAVGVGDDLKIEDLPVIGRKGVRVPGQSAVGGVERELQLRVEIHAPEHGRDVERRA